MWHLPLLGNQQFIRRAPAGCLASIPVHQNRTGRLGYPAHFGGCWSASLLISDLRKRGHLGSMAEGEEPEGVLDGTEQGVVVDLLGIAARVDVVADKDRRYRVDCTARVLVEGDDQPAVVLFGPAGVAVEVLVYPAVTSSDGAVVHAVAHVRAHKRHGRQLAIVAREGAERPVDACWQVGEVNPRVLLALVAARRASGEAHFGQGLGISGEAESSRSELMAQIFGPRKPLRAGIADHALGRPGEQREIVRLAGMCYAVRAGQVGASR